MKTIKNILIKNTEKKSRENTVKESASKMRRFFISSVISAATMGSSLIASATGGNGNDVTDTLLDVQGIIGGIVTGIGAIVTLIGFVMLGKSFISHDPAQRPQAIEFIAGGLIFAFAPTLMDLIL